MNKNIYLDNSATTRCLDEVVAAMSDALVGCYGNPSSMHSMGLEAERLLKTSRKTIAEALRVGEHEIFFTSGGTEANNWAIWGSAYQRKGRGRHVITTGIEHASVLKSFQRLAEDGFKVSFLQVDEEGIVDERQLEDILTDESIFISIMSVNNEIGTIQSINKLVKIIRSKNPNALIHVDAIQCFGKIEIYPKELDVDLLSISAHKIHGPKGIGALYIRKGVQIKPFLIGGEQEACYRAGTENVPGIVGLGAAVAAAKNDLTANKEKLRLLKERIINGLSEIGGAHINGPLNAQQAAPHIVNMWFEGIHRGEVLLHSLEMEGIYVSTGSACHSRRDEASHVLKELGLKGEALTGAIRVSLSHLNQEEEIDYFLHKLKRVVSELRELAG